MHRSILALSLLMITQAAHAEGFGSVTLSYGGGALKGPAVDTESEAEVFGHLSLSGHYARSVAKDWVLQGFGQVSKNVRNDTREGIGGDEGRNDNVLSFALVEAHAAKRFDNTTWGGFVGIWAGELEDGEPDIPGNIDRASKYYLGLQTTHRSGALGLYGQVGLSDTIGSDFSDVTDEGTDFRQVRDATFLVLGGTYDLNDALTFNGRVAALKGEGSDSRLEIDPLDLTGLYSEIGVTYRLPSWPVAVNAGIGHNYSVFDEVGEPVRSTYGFVGVSYAFGSDNARRNNVALRPADFLATADGASMGSLN